MPPRPAHLPDALVGLLPDRFQVLEQGLAAASGSQSTSGDRPLAGLVTARSITSPKTSSWNWPDAALPIRTGFDPS